MSAVVLWLSSISILPISVMGSDPPVEPRSPSTDACGTVNPLAARARLATLRMIVEATYSSPHSWVGTLPPDSYLTAKSRQDDNIPTAARVGLSPRILGMAGGGALLVHARQGTCLTNQNAAATLSSASSNPANYEREHSRLEVIAVATVSRFEVHPKLPTATNRKLLIPLSVLVLAVFAIFVSSCGTKEETGGGATTSPGDTTGVTDTSIKIGSLLPETGVAAMYGASYAKGMDAYFKYINDQGGIYGRKIDFIVGDSQYSGPIATEAARQLIDQDKVFAFIGNMGDSVGEAVKQMLDDQNIPDMFLLAGAQEFVSPVQHNRFVAQVTYTTEGKIIGTYLAANYAGKKVGILAQSDSYGKEGEAGIKQELQDENADVTTTTEYYDPSVTDVASQVTRLKGANVDVLVFFGGALPGASMIKTVRETLSWDVQLIMNEGSGAPAIASLVGANNLVGIITPNIFASTDIDKTPKFQELKQIFNQYEPGSNWDQEMMASVGMTTAQAFVGILKLTGPNLTRESFIAAAESVCNYQPDTTWMPESTSPTDHSFVEAEILTRGALNPDQSDPTRLVLFNPFGDIVNFESTPDCTPAKMPAEAKGQPGVDMGVY